MTFEFSQSEKDRLVSHSEMKIRCLITDIEKRLDKNQRDYWLIKTQLDKFTTSNYLVFSTDYNLAAPTLSLLTSDRDPHHYHLVNRWAVLTIKKKDDFEKVIEIQVEK